MGVATIQAQTTLQLRVDPEAITYNYVLNTKVEETYGGRVIQILSTTVTDLTVPCMAGKGGRQYLGQVASFFKNMMVWQRDSQNLGTFSYSPKNINLRVYAAALQIEDSTGNIAFPFVMQFKVMEDISGQAAGNAVDAEINKLKDGVGYRRNQYNDPLQNPPPPVPATDPDAGEGPVGGGAGGAGGGGAGGAPAPAGGAGGGIGGLLGEGGTTT